MKLFLKRNFAKKRVSGVTFSLITRPLWWSVQREVIFCYTWSVYWPVRVFPTKTIRTVVLFYKLDKCFSYINRRNAKILSEFRCFAWWNAVRDFQFPNVNTRKCKPDPSKTLSDKTPRITVSYFRRSPFEFSKTRLILFVYASHRKWPLSANQWVSLGKQAARWPLTFRSQPRPSAWRAILYLQICVVSKLWKRGLRYKSRILHKRSKHALRWSSPPLQQVKRLNPTLIVRKERPTFNFEMLCNKTRL